MNQKCYEIVLVIVATVLMGTLVNAGLMPLVNAQGAGDAYFTAVVYSSKVYDSTQDIWNFTVYNANLAVDIFNRAWFFVKFYLNGNLWYDEYASSGTWELTKGSSTTRYYSVPLGSGPATLNVKVELYWDNGGTPYLEDTTTFTVTVVKVFISNWSQSPSPMSVEKGKTAPSTLTVSLQNGGNDFMYSASMTIVDASGLTISPNSQTLGSIASGGTQSSSFSVTAPATATIGLHLVSFQITYNDFRGVSHTETKTASINGIKLGTNVVLALQPSSLKIGASTTITAKLTDDNNNALQNQAIDFTIGPTSLGSASTDSSGNAIKTYSATVDAGTYAIKASYSGSADYGSSTATSNLLVKALDTTVTMDVASATQGKECTLIATVKDEGGSPLQNMGVDFYIFEANAWTKIGSATTDSNGVATLTYTPSSLGTFQIKAMFNGTTNYAQSSSTSASLSVAMDYTLYYIGGAIIAIAIIGVVGYMVFQRRKKTTPPQK